MPLTNDELKVIAKETLINKLPYEYEKYLKDILKVLNLDKVKCDYDYQLED